jgi:pimeloyl-ACP methyl ester carboxylesterase
MNCVEYGKENSDVIVLLHGGGLSWWNYREVAEMLSDRFHVVLPILDGHSGSERNFTTIEDNATEIIEYIDAHYGGRVLLLGGLSLGAQILLEILSKRSSICRYALVESALVVPSKLTYAMIKPAFGSCYGLIQHKWFSKLQFASLKMKQDLFEDYYRDTCKITKRNMIAFLEENSLYSLKDSVVDCNAEVHIFVGAKENSVMKKSAKMIQEKLPGSSLTVLPKLYHGEFSINCAKDYVKRVLEIVKNK